MYTAVEQNVDGNSVTTVVGSNVSHLILRFYQSTQRFFILKTPLHANPLRGGRDDIMNPRLFITLKASREKSV